MVPLVGTVLVTSLLGSLHCAGMCGGFVAFYAGSDASRGWKRLAALAAYNGGRLVTYALLGAAVGAAVDLAGSLAGITRTAFLVAAVLMIGWGVWLLLQALNVRLPSMPAPALLGRTASRALAGISGKPPVARALILGLASTLLPCGWLYAFAILAAGTGSAAWGAVVMAGPRRPPRGRRRRRRPDRPGDRSEGDGRGCRGRGLSLRTPFVPLRQYPGSAFLVLEPMRSGDAVPGPGAAKGVARKLLGRTPGTTPAVSGHARTTRFVLRCGRFGGNIPVWYDAFSGRSARSGPRAGRSIRHYGSTP